RAGRAVWVGAVLVLVGLILDARGRRPVGFWMYLGGLAAIADGLAYFAVTSPDSEAWIPMLVVGALLLLFFAPMRRRLWAVFGAAGLAGAFGHYLDTQSGWFAYVLLAIALATFVGGLAVHAARMRSAAPEPPLP